MNVAPDAPTRPALRYYGGKWKLAPWIISYFPPHKNYVEPCGGAASVLLQKPRSPLETYNDLDGNVVNFFRVLRDRPDELIRKIWLTPFAKSEQLFCSKNILSTDEVESARRFFVSSWYSISGNPIDTTSGFASNSFHDQTYTLNIDLVRKTEDELNIIAKRFRFVQIEQVEFEKVVTRYDAPETLFYADPPYVKDERSHKNEYAFEWTNEDHARTADLLCQCVGYVIVSGYACPLYTELYESHGWQRFDKESQTNSGGKRIESVWLSPQTVEALQVNLAGLPLFELKEKNGYLS